MRLCVLGSHPVLDIMVYVEAVRPQKDAVQCKSGEFKYSSAGGGVGEGGRVSSPHLQPNTSYIHITAVK